MMSALTAVLLFGFVHPGSKLILSSGVSLLHFCLLYSGFRLLAQLPFVIVKKHYKIPSKMQLSLLVGLGLIGAALQWTEFKGISDGLPVSTVTFLLYSYPIWMIFLSVAVNKEKFTSGTAIKVFLSLIGMALIIGSQIKNIKFDTALIFPVLASVLMALWISLSNLTKKNGSSAWSLSFYFDSFAFLTLLAISVTTTENPQWTHLQNWISNGAHLSLIFGYSVMLGLLPNLLFYKASQNISTINMGLLLLLEPVISSAASFFIWGETLNDSFVLGAAFLLASNVSFKYFFTPILAKFQKEFL